ncbi:hypothetical protein [Paraflavitalea speifideaquila]|uniref:hypothetical protein n=1 Tax=Paraflavitalea speifideaquila TaxID=3076558 RepID=UPI0028F0B3E9|nr:hypothetical protein [Paraflavitalea speifideiaquila]
MKNISFISNIAKRTSPPAIVPNSTPFFKPTIQPKLTINQPNDIYEQEADAMAEKVMRMPGNVATNNFIIKPAISSIQRKCAHCEEEEKKAQLKEKNNGVSEPSQETENYIYALSGGRTLSEQERDFLNQEWVMTLVMSKFTLIRMQSDQHSQ